ncbi:hypothetical protein D3C78_1425790 [compost metagenome]
MTSVRTLNAARVSSTSFQSMRWASSVNNTISSKKNSAVRGFFTRCQRECHCSPWDSGWFMGLTGGLGGRCEWLQAGFVRR